DLSGCHVGVRADVLRGMQVGIPAWQAKRLLHGGTDASVCQPGDFFTTPQGAVYRAGAPR
ncbi:MAG: hypothetical protein WBQ65_15795, partial [Bryobacteraceae bacterium]